MNRLIAVFAFVLLALSLPAAAQVDPCKLLTPAEIENALGGKLSGYSGNAPMSATIPTCAGGILPKRMSVMVMFAAGDAKSAADPKWADPLGYLEQMSRQSADSIKAKMEAKRFGSSILCTTLIPPKQGPYATQCMAVKKPTGMATISILVPAQQDMVSMDTLRPLAEKMLGRF
ncbi:MAG TPA: hypothetical protein VKL40_10585 [Candidatus Angelobacter sp.]|nr:hypothetical protein [Candidatus Angelobacter sp.]